jgi:hypothetical protein
MGGGVSDAAWELLLLGRSSFQGDRWRDLRQLIEGIAYRKPGQVAVLGVGVVRRFGLVDAARQSRWSGRS